MGKNTVVTRRGVRAYTLATGERDIGRESFGCPTAMRRRAPYRLARCQWAKPFWSRIAPGVTRVVRFAHFGGSLWALERAKAAKTQQAAPKEAAVKKAVAKKTAATSTLAAAKTAS